MFVLLVGPCSVAAEGGGSPETQLVLLLTVDTLRRDRMGVYGSELDLTPNLDALARKSEVFSNAFAPAPFTLPSLVAFHTGLYPEQAGVHSNTTPLPGDVPTIAKLLRNAGWRTGAVVSNYVVREHSGLAAGFDYYDARFPQLEAVRKLPERTAAATTDHAIEALDALVAEGSGRVLLWVHYQDPHGPYLPPGDLRRRYLADEAARPDGSRELAIAPGGLGGLPPYQALAEEVGSEEVGAEEVGAGEAGAGEGGEARLVRNVAAYRAAYDGEVRYMDTQLGRLLRAIEERGLAERATIVFAADHGESLGERDYWFAHGEYLNEAVMQVPLMIRAPGRRPQRRTELVGLIDVFPTLVSHLGVVAPGGTSRPGRDLLAEGAPLQRVEGADSELASAEPATEELAVAEQRALLISNLAVAQVPRRGIVTNAYRLIVEASAPDSGVSATVRVYRAGSDVPLSSSSANSAERKRRTELRGRLRTLRKAFPARKPQVAPLSAEETERLRSLGYLEE